MNFKNQGNEYFNKQNYGNAIDFYKKAISSLKLSSKFKEVLSQTNIENIKIECFNNIAICYLVKQKEYNKVIDYTQYSLDLQRKNYKALYIRSKALKKLSRWEEAMECIKEVSQVYFYHFL